MVSNPELTDKLRSQASSICESRGWVLGSPLPPGGTSAVYEVMKDGIACALKVYDPTFLKDRRGEATRARFSLMLEKLKGHTCPYLVEIYDGGECDETLWLLMARVPGNCLVNVLESVPRNAIRRIIDNVARAARFLEELGLCHRDIKSENIVVSEDFQQAVLLDLGVIRQVDDDGAGTDNDGQLPFVATAQYSSPEYMFRLFPLGPRLWLGLTYYQLGAVLHDMIMRVPLFDDVVRQSKENRYLIAYAVATRIPVVAIIPDVPQDLTLIAQRALDKDLERRLAAVNWDDFIDDAGKQQRRYEVLLGLQGGPQRPVISKKRQIQLQQLANSFCTVLDGRFVAVGIHAKREIKNIAPDRICARFIWSPPALGTSSTIASIIEFADKDGRLQIDAWAETTGRQEPKISTQKFPAFSAEMPVGDPIPSVALESVYEAGLRVSAEITTLLRQASAS